MRRHLGRVAGWLRNLDLYVLLACLVLVVGLLAYVKIADWVGAGRTQSMDDAILIALLARHDPTQTIGPKWMAEVGRDLTALGGVVVLTLMTTAVVGFLAICKKYHAMLFVLAAVGGGLVISSLLKHQFDRPRPDVVPHLSGAFTSSFPSGHSMMAATVYLTLGALLARLVERVWLKVYLIGVALTVTLLVGLSRVYMGVHYPTDVLAGWSAGLAWAMVCWLVARFLQRRGTVERSAVDDEETQTM